MIKIINLSKSYNNKKVFENLNLEIPSNKLVFIVGKSGIGKSTLLKIISGYEKEDNGTIEFLEAKENNFKNIDFIFQDFNLIKGLSAIENLQVGVNSLGFNFDKNKAMTVLNQININEKIAHKKIELLSGGEQQRVAIARSVLRDTNLLLADEPTGNLDFQNSETIFEYLKKISTSKTVIVVTHDIENAKKFGDHIIEIKKDGIKQNDLNNSNDTSLKTTDKERKTKTTTIKNKLVLIPKFLKIDVRKKIIQTLFIILSFVTTILAFGTLMQYKNTIVVQNNVLKTSFLQSDRLVIKNKNSDVDFKNKDLELFEKLPNITNISKSYQFGLPKFKYNDTIVENNLNLEFVDYNDFYKKRMVNNISLGSFPKNNNEIIISKELAEKLKITDPIGKSVFYGYEFNDFEELKISAVNNIIDITKKNTTFISNELIKELNQRLLNKLDNISLWNSSNDINIKPFYSGKFLVNDEKLNLKLTNLSNNSTDDFPKMWINRKLYEEQKLKLNQKISADFYGHRLIFNVSGIAETSEYIIVVSKEANEFYGKVNPSTLSIYFNESVDVNTLAKELSEKRLYNKFKITSNNSTFVNRFNDSNKNIVVAFQIILGILLTISILFSFGFTKILNDAKKEEVGLLKSLGASLKQILMYHISYFVLINIIVFIASFILYVPSQILINSFLESSENLDINYSIGFENIFIMWLVVFVFSTVIFSAFSYHKFKKRINTLIK